MAWSCFKVVDDNHVRLFDTEPCETCGRLCESPNSVIAEGSKERFLNLGLTHLEEWLPEQEFDEKSGACICLRADCNAEGPKVVGLAEDLGHQVTVWVDRAEFFVTNARMVTTPEALKPAPLIIAQACRGVARAINAVDLRPAC